MCGILAISAPRAGVLDDRAVRSAWDGALNVLSRRGPDGRGTWISPCGRTALGHTRLAVQDLSGSAAQPMVRTVATAGGRDSAVAISYNGEIYNVRTLRDDLRAAGAPFLSTSDTEVVLAGYIHWGIDRLLERLRGMFALVIWDGRGADGGDSGGVLHAAVDHAGMKPLVFFDRPGYLAIASDCDALRAAVGGTPELDPLALCDVLSLGYIPAPRTVWAGVGKLGPGEALRWTPHAGLERRRWWNAPEECVDEAGLQACARSLPDQTDSHWPALWHSVIDEHFVGDVPIGLFLSGGIDSAAVALAIAGQAGRGAARARAITIAMPGAADESPAAGALAAAIGLDHRTVQLADANADTLLSLAAGAFDEPHAATATLPAVAIARAARLDAGLKVILAGDGGDEAFAGYHWHRAEDHPLALCRAAGRGPSPLTQAQRGALASPGGDPGLRIRGYRSLGSLSFTHALLARQFPLFHPVEAAALLAPLSPRYDEHTYAAWLSEHDRPTLPWRRRAQRLDLYGFCAGHVLPKVDRAAMSVGLELRAPFLDRRVLEWGLTRADSPDEDRAAESKPVLRNYLSADGRVPPGHLGRKKQGFSLKAGAADLWWSRAAAIDRSRLVRDGLLRPDWRGFVEGVDPEWRELRVFALHALAAWYEHHPSPPIAATNPERQ